MRNNNGFSLVELIAVITILGIISLIAIPNVTSYITNSRKDSYSELGKNYISSVRSGFVSKDYYVKGNANLTCNVPPVGKYTAIRIENIAMEDGVSVSPFKKSILPDGTSSKGYVIAVNVGNITGENHDVVYYFASIDAGKNGIDQFIEEKDLSGDSVKVGKANISTSSNYKKNLLSKTNAITIKTGRYKDRTFSFYQECGGLIDD